jgi:predicted PurR-regulated permease PerM
MTHQADEAELRQVAASFRRQIAFWIVGLILLSLFMWMFRTILLPFVAGLALAYFLDPVADRLERMGLSRLSATFVILTGFILVFVIALMLIVPVLATQTVDFIDRVPSYLTKLQELVSSINPLWLESKLGLDVSTLRESTNTLLRQGAGVLTTVLQSVWNSGKALIDLASLFVVTPVVAFYMLLDWDKMVARVDGWVPRDDVATVRRLASEVNLAIAGFVRGQGTVCLILAIMYAVGLTLAGLNFGLLIGLVSGLISFIPFVGSLVGLVLSVGVALVQFWPDYLWVGAVAAIFFAGQFFEGNILQPKLVGSSVGLHPVWLMFALFAFGSLFGFVGMLVAVPLAAAVGVLVRFGLERYLASPLYRGHSE